MLLLLCQALSAVGSELQVLAPTVSKVLSNSTVIVHGETTRPVVLQSMFNPYLDTVIFQIEHFQLVPAAWDYINSDTPYVMTRNFTIASSRNPPTILDFSFLDRKVALAPGYVFTFHNVVLTNSRWVVAIDVSLCCPTTTG